MRQLPDDSKDVMVKKIIGYQNFQPFLRGSLVWSCWRSGSARLAWPDCSSFWSRVSMRVTRWDVCSCANLLLQLHKVLFIGGQHNAALLHCRWRRGFSFRRTHAQTKSSRITPARIAVAFRKPSVHQQTTKTTTIVPHAIPTIFIDLCCSFSILPDRPVSTPRSPSRSKISLAAI